eukprot:jgi/Botrbrau1/7325/Bobra.247_3s0020.1
MEDLETACSAFQERHKDSRIVVGVGVDGSSVSDQALAVGNSLVSKDRGDKLVMLHVADASKKYLPQHLSPVNLHHHFAGRAAQLQVQAEWHQDEKGHTKSTCEALTRLAEFLKTDILVLGSFGRKGEKLDMLGSTSDQSLRQCAAHICIVKSTSPKLEGPKTWCFATDNSPAAHTAFAILLFRVVQKGDTVHVLHVTQNSSYTNSGELVLAPYRRMLETHKIEGRCVTVHHDGNVTVSSAIIHAAEKLETDVLVVGISGFGHQKLGSVSEDVVRMCRCTVLVLKGPV